MKKIKIKEELEDWLVDYITDYVHKLEAVNTPENEEFNKWAKSFKREEAKFVVKTEFVNDWYYDERTEILENEATEYAQSLLRVILDNWYL